MNLLLFLRSSNSSSSSSSSSSLTRRLSPMGLRWLSCLSDGERPDFIWFLNPSRSPVRLYQVAMSKPKAFKYFMPKYDCWEIIINKKSHELVRAFLDLWLLVMFWSFKSDSPLGNFESFKASLTPIFRSIYKAWVMVCALLKMSFLATTWLFLDRFLSSWFQNFQENKLYILH